MDPLRAVKGMNDILPQESARGSASKPRFGATSRSTAFARCARRSSSRRALFVRAIGEATDIVEKEMYSFERHDEDLTLRPEGTAGAARAYVEHKVHNDEPVSRWYYLGPMFRGERPAAGRYRQFYQAGAEIFGDPGPGCDAEMIDMLVSLLDAIGIPDVGRARQLARQRRDAATLQGGARRVLRRRRRRRSAPSRSAASRRTRSASSTRRTRAINGVAKAPRPSSTS